MSDPKPRLDTATFSSGTKVPARGGEALHPGQRLAERYEIRSLLGRGGMGEVWRAYDLKLRVEVALKSILPERVGSEARHEALRREVRAAREVVSPNVCRVFDLVDAEGNELVSMEYVDGQTLTRLLQDRSPLGPREVRDLASQFLAGLEAIHLAGLVHRDFKPENVMVTRAGRVVVMDLGITTPSQAKGETVAGTAAYMAPEQARAEEVDARADVFAAGVVLAEMTSPRGIADQTTRQRLREGLRSDPPRVPEGPWSGVIRKAVSPLAQDRYASARELSRALDGVTLRVERGEDRHPYPGLVAFTETDAEHFFGREAEVEALLRKLGPARLLAIAGPSGAGKSSFLQAGLVPALQEGWSHVVFHPRERPFASLAQALLPELSGDAEAMGELLRIEEIDAAVSAVRRWRQRHDRALLIADQFEELFTLSPPEVQERFAELLGRLPLEADVHVLVSMRDDFLIRCHEHEALAPVVSDLTLLTAPTGAALRRALLQPAVGCGYRFEDEALVEEMLGEVERERGALPLVAFAAARLWEKRDRERGLLTREAYEEMGGVAGALAQHAEATLERIGTSRTPLVRELFRNLVTAQGTRAARERDELLSVFADAEAAARPGDGGVAEGVNSARTELSGGHSGHRVGSRTEAEEVLNTLVDARLLTSFERAREGSGERRLEIEIVHESLLTAWPRLVRWQTQDADGAQLRDQLRQAARLWDEKGRPEDLLWSGTPFLEYRAWRARYPGRLSAVEEDFARDMTARARRAQRRLRVAAVTLLAAVTGVAVSFAVLWQRSDDARRAAEAEARRREAAQILSLGRLRLDGNPTAALAHAIASLEASDNEPARRFAVEALWRGPPAFQVNDDTHPCEPAWSPDGRWLALGGPAGLTLYDRDGGGRRKLDSGWTETEGFSSDSSRLMTVAPPSGDLWSLPDALHLETWPLRGAFGALIDRWLVSVTPEDGEGGGGSIVVRERSIDGGPERVLARWPKDRFPDLSLAAEDRLTLSRRTLTSFENGRLVQRQLDAPQAPPRILGRHEGDPTVWAWPGSERLATGDGTGEVRVWDADRGRLERSLRSPASARFLALDPSERYIAAAPARGPLRPRSLHVFDLETPRGTVPFALLDDENGVLNDMSFHPRGRLLASGHYPNGTFLWNLTTPRSMVLRGHNGPSRIVFAPDGRLVSMASAGDVRVWPLWTSPESEPLVVGARGQGRQELRPGELEISGDGGLAVVAEQSQRRFWLLPLDGSPGTARERTGDDGVISGVTLAPDDRRLAFGLALWGRPEVASIRILDLVTGERRVLRPEDTTGACVMNSPELGPAELPLWLPDGRLVSEGALGLRLWDLEDGSSRLLRACRDSTEPPRLVATPDSSAVLTLFNPKPAPGESSTLLASELATGVAREITAHGRRLLAIGLDPTGKALVTGDMNGVVRVGAIAGGEPHLLYGHSGPVTGVAVSPDGRWIASASDDDTIRLWPMPDLSKPPLHTLPYDELLEKLRSLTNLRVVPDPDSATGYTLETAPFPGWKDLSTW